MNTKFVRIFSIDFSPVVCSTSIFQVVLCFSPVGFTLRTRARRFPALVNCTAIDWFHPWPQLALQSVSTTFVEKIPGLEVLSIFSFGVDSPFKDKFKTMFNPLQPNVRKAISEFICHAHTSVDKVNSVAKHRGESRRCFVSCSCPTASQVSAKYQQNEKHFNYTTPKSFLEFMKLYGNLLGKKRTELSQKMERLDNGLQKLQSTASQVSNSVCELMFVIYYQRRGTQVT